MKIITCCVRTWYNGLRFTLDISFIERNASTAFNDVTAFNIIFDIIKKFTNSLEKNYMENIELTVSSVSQLISLRIQLLITSSNILL